uniref:Rieske (2Fe-2S) region n=2 Tax=unclassified Mycobacterium TaxID=2642494 RepID=A0A5Q5BRP3_MYCSS
MSAFADIKAKWAKSSPFQVLPHIDWAEQKPTYQDALPALINDALARAKSRPSGNWFPFAASDAIRRKPVGASVGGVELVAWRGACGELRVGPASCPHLGADLSTGTVDCGTLICPWHGLRLSGERREFGWKPLPAFDDGVLAWVRLDRVGGEQPTDRPIIPVRPAEPRLHAVTSLVGVCEPDDVIANRLDPWHGAWFHPYSFTRLEVLSAPAAGEVPEAEDRFLVAVTFRIGRLGVPVVAEFIAPGPRTIVMRIVDGEGAGSVVETHATPVGPGPDGRPRTAVIEAVVAHSDRRRFGYGKKVAPLITPFMRHAATKLWRDDLAYAERRYAVRSQLNRR